MVLFRMFFFSSVFLLQTRRRMVEQERKFEDKIKSI